jgi:PIN domain nuclease of toxin-antitoxin system
LDSEIVIDASAALCFLQHEPGWEGFPDFAPFGTMCVVNYAEVVQRLLRYDADGEMRARLLMGFGLRLVDAGLDVALGAARLEAPTRIQGISLGDRFCLAFAMERKAPVLTADKPWKSLGLPIEIKFLR